MAKLYVLMGKCGSISTLFGHYALSTGQLHPSFRSEDKTVQAGLSLNCLEFEVIEFVVIYIYQDFGGHASKWR